MLAFILTLWLLTGYERQAVPAAPRHSASSAPLGREAQALIAPVLESIAAERALQAVLPPPADDCERLVRMGRLDQVGRQLEAELDLSSLPEHERAVAWTALMTEMGAVDAANQAALLEMVPPEGWFHRSRYGSEASQAAFLIVQHANIELWRRFVPVLEPLVLTGEVDGAMFALMYDRLALAEGRPQRYGSQMICVEGRYRVAPLEDAEGIDARRAAVGLGPLADYVAVFSERPSCGS